MSYIIEEEAKNIVSNINFELLRDKKILITGASGLIGIFLIASLKEIKEKYNISIYAWINNSLDDNISRIFSGCNILQGDITNINTFQDMNMFDCIIHAAGYGQPTKFMDDKIKTIHLNTTTIINLFKYLNPNGKFLFVSTSELYSGLDYENITEEQIGITNTNHPRSCYIEGKRCGEAICYSYIDKGFDIKIIRLSLAYGPGTKKNDGRVLNSLIQKGLTENSIRLMDSGDAIRTYGYITDIIEMFWNILLFGKEILYNVGGKSITTILELARLIGFELNKKVIIPNVSQEILGNPKFVNISLNRYLSEFKKENFISLKDGIEKTIKWQKKIYNGTNNT
jgi:nucleoside-diphosphate-sugar epimerase